MTVKVQIRNNESLEAAIRRFKRHCNQGGIFNRMKDLSFFSKPTWDRREAKMERMRVIRRAERVRRQARF